MTLNIGGTLASTAQRTALRAELGAVTHWGTVANEAAMVALSSAVVGDLCSRTDTGTVWILSTGTYETAGNWQDTGAVDSIAWGSVTGTLSAQTDLQSALDAKGDALAPVTLTGNTTLTRSSHYNRTIIVNAAGSVSLAVTGTDALVGDFIDVTVIGGGNVTLTGITPVSGYTLAAASGGSVQAVCATDASMIPATRTWQDALVSQTNIKSVNGTTLLGSGDLTVTASPPSWLDAGISFAAMPCVDTSITTLNYSGQADQAYSITSTTSANPGVDYSTLLLSRPSVTWTAASALNALVGLRSSPANLLGLASGDPQWTYEMMFSVHDALTSSRMQAGVCSAYMSGANEPTATYQGNGIFLGCNSGDSQFKLYIRRTGADTASTYTLNGGTGFPCNDSTKLFYVRFKFYNSSDAGGHRVEYTFKNLSDSITVTGTWDGTGGQPAMPASGICGGPSCYRGVASGATDVPAVRFYGMAGGKFAG